MNWPMKLSIMHTRGLEIDLTICWKIFYDFLIAFSIILGQETFSLAGTFWLHILHIIYVCVAYEVFLTSLN